MMAPTSLATASLLLAVVALGWTGEPAKPVFALASTTFAANAVIPSRCAGEGQNISPELHWSGAPAGTKSFALVVDDPDADGFLHWVVWRIPATTAALPEGGAKNRMPTGAVQGENHAGTKEWFGPAPPAGPAHRYRFTLYALSAADVVADQALGKGLAALEQSLRGRILGKAELQGRFATVEQKK